MPAAAPARPRSAFARTEVPRRERATGIAITALLGLIAAAFFWKGRHYDPSTYQPDPAKLESASEASQLPGTAPAGTGGLTGSSTAPAAPAAAAPALDPATAALFEPALEDAAPGGPIETYNPATLYEKINGRAPAYLQYHFSLLACRTFVLHGNAENFVDLYAYDMASPAGAYGIFSLERDASGKPVAFAPDGYESSGSYFFRKGRFYIQVLASGDDTAELAGNIAAQVAAQIPADDTGLENRSILPAENQVPGSAELVATDAQGLPFLKDVHQATYTHGGAELRFFMMAAPDPATASTAWEQYKAFCAKYGRAADAGEIAGARVFTATVLGSQRAIFVRGDRLGGVFEGSDPAAALAFVQQFLESAAPTP